MAQHRFPAFRVGFRRKRRPVFQIGVYLPENPRISPGCPADHDAVAPGLPEHPGRAFPICDIPVADDRNGNGFFHFGNDFPVRTARIELLPRPPMHRNCRSSRIFKDSGHFHRVNMFFIEAAADFHRNGFFYRMSNRGNNFSRQLRILHQRGTLPVVDDFRHRAAHIDIQYGKRAFFQLFCDFAHNGGVGTE